MLLALGCLVALSLALRCIGLGRELPQQPDEDPLIVGQAESLRRVLAGEPVAGTVEPHYPLVLAYTLALWPLPAHDAAAERADPLAYHLERAARPHHRARLLVALISTLAVPFTWLLARRFVGPWWALFAAALVATSLQHVHLSQSARPHGALATYITLALWLDVRLLERGRTRDHLLAGAATALAIGCLHTGASTLLPLVAAQLVRLRRDGARAALRAAAAWVLVAALVWLAYLGPLADARAAQLTSNGGDVTLSGHVFPRSVFDGGGFARMGPLLWLADPLLSVLGAIGLGVAIVRVLRRRAPPGAASRLLCVWALPYLVVMGMYSRVPARFLLPLVPLLALLAALGLAHFTATATRRFLPILAALALLALPTFACARLAWLNSRPDAATQVARWLERNADREHDLIHLSALASLPLFLRDEDGGRLYAADFSYWDAYLAELPPELREAHGWRTRRMISGEIGRRRIDQASQQAVLDTPPARPVRRRLAVVSEPYFAPAWDPAPAVLRAASARELWRCEVEDAPRAHHELAIDVGVTLASVLARTRQGQRTVVYELPPLAAETLGDR
ncbi:MAG TPA: glycosyltransferase family 39 protein [Planctomycetota bacterium]|nr:glycosyltransferase family 39 protein [Planctomycetota bacterium]